MVIIRQFFRKVLTLKQLCRFFAGAHPGARQKGWRSRRHPSRMRISIVIALSAIILYASAGTHAEARTIGDHEWVTEGFSRCNAVPYTPQVPGTARAALHYKMYNPHSKRAYLEHMHATVDQLIDCGRGRPLRAGRIEVTTILTLFGTNLNCGVGISVPPGVSFNCSGGGSDITYTDLTTCGGTACDIRMDALSFSAGTGQTFRDWREMQIRVKLIGPGGSQIFSSGIA